MQTFVCKPLYKSLGPETAAKPVQAQELPKEGCHAQTLSLGPVLSRTAAITAHRPSCRCFHQHAFAFGKACNGRIGRSDQFANQITPVRKLSLELAAEHAASRCPLGLTSKQNAGHFKLLQIKHALFEAPTSRA